MYWREGAGFHCHFASALPCGYFITPEVSLGYDMHMAQSYNQLYDRIARAEASTNKQAEVIKVLKWKLKKKSRTALAETNRRLRTELLTLKQNSRKVYGFDGARMEKLYNSRKPYHQVLVANVELQKQIDIMSDYVEYLRNELRA
jgi:hypothetical protein